ncbi:Trafficking protein particle complex subunit 2 - like 1 [Theobroma cacao]|nr:Trafficking protein particle complex subunit 2 - like 1 [Theobroma cacao]
MIVCVAVVGYQNNPLYIQSFTDADDALKLHHIVHCSLDVVDERVNNPKKSGPTLNETFLGLLYPTENYKVYGYLTNTKVKFILVTTDLDVRDADVRNFFKRFHAAYVDAVSNPFHVPGKKITSRTFAERVSTIVKSFGLSSYFSLTPCFSLTGQRHKCQFIWSLLPNIVPVFIPKYDVPAPTMSL